jgi:Ran GTPase-activating protein (RanGAP) involved in mRNA processing and transport
MHGIGSVSRLWRKLAKGVLMGDELAWLKVPGAAAAAECMSSFPRALSLRIVGGARAGDIGSVLGSRSVMRLAIANNHVMRGCEGLDQLVGLRALYITECGRLRDAAALSALVDLRTLHLNSCELRTGSLASSLARMAQLTSLDLSLNDIGDAGAASLAPSLAPMAQLTSLKLGYNAIGDAGAASLAPSLVRMARLTSLDLSDNGIYAAGAASLAPSLAQMAQLTSLDLSDNGIGAAGAASLAPSLALMAQLTSLDLGGNDIGAAGAASLAPSLALMARLTSLSDRVLPCHSKPLRQCHRRSGSGVAGTEPRTDGTADVATPNVQ